MLVSNLSVKISLQNLDWKMVEPQSFSSKSPSKHSGTQLSSNTELQSFQSLQVRPKS